MHFGIKRFYIFRLLLFEEVLWNSLIALAAQLKQQQLKKHAKQLFYIKC
jgi:hypothetical protein